MRQLGPCPAALQEAEEYGICKIVPPEGWRPPFAIDRENFKFNTRIQASVPSAAIPLALDAGAAPALWGSNAL